MKRPLSNNLAAANFLSHSIATLTITMAFCLWCVATHPQKSLGFQTKIALEFDSGFHYPLGLAICWWLFRRFLCDTWGSSSNNEEIHSCRWVNTSWRKPAFSRLRGCQTLNIFVHQWCSGVALGWSAGLRQSDQTAVEENIWNIFLL